MFVIISSIKSIKRLVARAKVTIVFLIHLHIVMMREIKNVRKIMNKRKISVRMKKVCIN